MFSLFSTFLYAVSFVFFFFLSSASSSACFLLELLLVLRLNLCYDFVGLHPFLHVVAEQGGDVEQDHQRAGHGQRQHGCLCGTRLDDGDSLVYSAREIERVRGERVSAVLPDCCN